MFDTTSHTLPQLRSSIESALETLLRAGELSPAVRYAVFSGGKRIRPVLTLLAAEACGGDVQTALPAACAIEYLHCASLIWDDMPSMDNAPERRGLSAVHIIFGEGIATLAALSLLNQAYEILGRYSGLGEQAVACLNDMIDGQAADLQQGPRCDHRKTTGLMRLTLTAGAIACGLPKPDICVLARCGEFIGQAYQIFDDIEDGDPGCQTAAEDLIAGAKSILQDHFGPRISPLIAAVDEIASHFAHRRMVAA